MSLEPTPLRTELNDILRFLPAYARNPVDAIRSAPEWSWPAMISLQLGLAMLSGVVAGLFSFSFVNFLLGLIVFPLTSLLQVAVLAFFLLTFFALAHHTYLNRRRLLGLIILANIPYVVLHAASGIASPLDLIGFGLTCLLLIVALSEHFRIERKLLLKLLGGVYAVFCVVWAGTQWRNSERADRLEDRALPRSIESLEKEMQK